MHGISLIPPVHAWPDSSLAQMVAWISEIIPVTYIPEGSPIPRFERPIWLFGTAFHHVIAIESNQVGGPLPAGSIVIDTGGTKGRTRDLTRHELLDLCAKVYEAPVLSEYGMCELASQAYDWGSGFRFPRWVSVAAVSGINRIRPHGECMLLVQDNLRIDYPTAIRTEDVIHLNGDGSFELIGRAPSAPLRGCSLNVYEVPRAVEFKNLLKHESITIPSRQTLETQALKIENQLRNFLNQKETLKSLKEELGSENAAQQAINDLQRGLPRSADEWSQGAQNASSGKSHLPRNWIFVLPRNHSLVVTYPLAFAKVLGLNVSLKVPKELASNQGFIARYAQLLDTPILNTDRKLPASDAILCYGTDETVASIRRLQASSFVRGYGHNVTIAIAPVVVDVSESAPLIARDVLSTAQRGCLAPRAFILQTSGTTTIEEIALRMLKATREFWSAPTSLATRLGFERENHRLKKLGFCCFGGENDESTLIAIKVLQSKDVTYEEIMSACARHPMTIPLCLVLENHARDFVKSFMEILKPGYPLGLSITTELGSANAPKWDGFHLGKPLFAD